MLIVGAAAIASLRGVLMATTDDPEVKLSESVSVRVTVGAVLSMVKVILVVPA